jgi:hypothetical protein
MDAQAQEEKLKRASPRHAGTQKTIPTSTEHFRNEVIQRNSRTVSALSVEST